MVMTNSARTILNLMPTLDSFRSQTHGAERGFEMVSDNFLSWTRTPKYTYCLAITILGLLCLIPTHATAAPSITGIMGTATHGSAMTITGSSFGTGDTTPLTWDDFEDGTVGQNLAASPKVGTWALGDTPIPQYSNSYAHSGTKSSYGSKPSDGSNLYTQFSSPSSGGALTDTYYYASWWGYWHANCSNLGQVKLIQFWGTYQVGDYNPGVFHGYGSSTYIALESAGFSKLEWIRNAAADGWHQYQLVLKQSDVNVANGTVQIYLDGALIYNQVSVVTRERSGEYWQKLIPHEGMTNQSGCSGTRFFALDDFYFNNSWTRVVLGNASTYAASTKFDLQPVNWQSPLWSASSINVKFNQGEYTNGQTVYLYVVDATGAVNANGFAVTIGNGSGVDTAPPVAPVNLRIQ